MFSRGGAAISERDVTDGTSNTIMVGETLPSCVDHGEGWWSNNGRGNAHAATLAPINDMRTCTAPLGPDGQTTCLNQNDWTYSWGFRSAHEGGAHFLMTDGSVHLLSENIDHQTYVWLGNRRDGEAAQVTQ